MCSGYLADQIEAKFGDGRAWDVTIEYSREQQPLGTAGAINQVRPLLRDAVDFVVMNGDSFLDADFGKLVDFRRLHKSLVSLAIVQVENAGRYGTVSVGPDMRVIGFNEKTGISAAGLINAGIYVFDRTIFDYISDGPSSLERDVFPRILERGIYALQQEGLFIDIGTPEDYARARTLFEQLSAAASRQ
jgi:NDP-sugar pyrophosphorylase family protein